MLPAEGAREFEFTHNTLLFGWFKVSLKVAVIH